MGNFFDDLFGIGDSPSYRETPIDPGLKQSTKDIYKRAEGFDKSKYVQEKMAGAEQAGALMARPSRPQESSNLDAIREKSRQMYSQSLGKIQRQSELGAIDEAQSRISRSNLYTQRIESMVNLMKERRLREESDRVAARNQVIGSIIGTVGTFAGYALAGPIGGVAGGVAGGAIAPKGNFSSDWKNPDQYSFGVNAPHANDFNGPSLADYNRGRNY